MAMQVKKDNIIYGRNPIREALNTKKVKRIFLSNSFTHQEILDLIKRSKIEVKIVSNRELDSISNTQHHQGIAGEIKDFEYFSLDSILHNAKKQDKAIIVILDGINDPHNFGAILRCCDVFNVSGVIIGKHNQVPLNATVAKTSAGAINYVPVAVVSNLNQAIEKLKENGFWVVSTDGSGTQNYQDIKYDFNVALVVGSEGKGISSLVLRNSDYVVKIPQYGHVNSLNASVATGILLSKIRE